ncbi:MAG: CoA transferase [Chloroflexi bacterium]|nr:CoA transferase [Chloroflexota bacterium]
MGLPLESLRITDFTWVAAGPLWTRLLALMGAEVIKVESATRLDYVRVSQPIAPGAKGVNASGRYYPLNTGKLGVAMNLRHPAGKALVQRLVSISDVVADNFSAGVLTRLGLGYQDLRRLRPDIVAISMPVMGQEGPLASYRGLGPQIEALAGLKYLSGSPDKPPVGFTHALPDFTCNPYFAAAAVMAALHYRHHTGRGQFVDFAQYESTVAMVGEAVLEYTANGTVPQRRGNRHPGAVPHNSFPAAGHNTWVALACFTEVQWHGLLQAMEEPPWAREGRFATFGARKAHEEELEQHIAQWTRQHDAWELAQRLREQGVPASAVETAADILERDPQLQHRGFWSTIVQPAIGPTAHASPAFRFLAGPGVNLPGWAIQGSAPELGQHNPLVFQELLGVSAQEYLALVQDGAIEDSPQEVTVSRDRRRTPTQ